jgi:hypothetical protein
MNPRFFFAGAKRTQGGGVFDKPTIGLIGPFTENVLVGLKYDSLIITLIMSSGGAIT